jgi:vacuolar-type H+-ATPase subunit H
LTNIAIAIITLAGAYAVLYINKGIAKVKAETEKIQDEKQRALVNSAIDRVGDLTKKTVGSLEQVSAKSIREAVKTGIEDREKLLAIGKQAVDEIYGQLSEDTIKLLETEMFDVEKYITDTVESEVLKLKEGQK